jgi:hypothetical protein
MTRCQCESTDHDHKTSECPNQGLPEKEGLCESCYYLVLNERAAGWASSGSDIIRPTRTWADNSWWMRRDQEASSKAPSLPEKHPFYLLVGRVASEWSHLEHILDTTIWNLLNIQHMLAACVTSQIMGVGPRCKAIITLGHARNLPDECMKPYGRLMGDSYKHADWRARYIHDLWFTETPDIAKQFRAMPYIDKRFGEQEIDKADIQKLLIAIKSLQTRASDLRGKISAALEELPKTNA